MPKLKLYSRTPTVENNKNFILLLLQHAREGAGSD